MNQGEMESIRPTTLSSKEASQSAAREPSIIEPPTEVSQTSRAMANEKARDDQIEFKAKRYSIYTQTEQRCIVVMVS